MSTLLQDKMSRWHSTSPLLVAKYLCQITFAAPCMYSTLCLYPKGYLFAWEEVNKTAAYGYSPDTRLPFL